MNSLTKYAEEIQKRASSPHELADLLVEMSVDFATANNNKIQLAVLKAEFFRTNKKIESEKPLSDAMVNSMFLLTEDGLKHAKNEIYITALKSLMSNIKAALRNLENESHNQY